MKKLLSFLSCILLVLSIARSQNISYIIDTSTGCPPLTVTFTNTSTGMPPTVQYEWDFNGLYFIGPTDTMYTFETSGYYRPRLIAYDTTINGDTSILLGDYIGEEISVLGTDNIDTDPNDSVCINDEVEFGIYNSYQYGSSFEWEFPGGIFKTGSDVKHTFTTGGIRYVQAIVTGVCGIDTLQDSIFVSNSLKPKNLYKEISPNPVCPDDNISFYANGDNTGSYSWNVAPSINIPNYKATYSYLNEGPVTVSIKYQNGCGADTTLFDVVNIQSNLTNYGSYLDFVMLPEEVCPGDEAAFVTFSDNTPNLVWNFGDGSTSTQTSVIHAYNNTGTYPVSLIATNGCGVDTIVSKVFKVKNNIVPPLVNGADNGGDDIGSGIFGIANSNGDQPDGCPGDSILFFMWGIVDATWDFGDGTVAQAHDIIQIAFEENVASIPVTVIKHAYSDTGIYEVIVTASNNCNNSNTDTIYTHISNNSGASNAEFGISAPQGLLPCKDIKFFSLGAASYEWDFGDGTTLTTTSAEVFHSYDNSGTYNVTLTSTNSCNQTSSETYGVTIAPIGTPSANYTSDIQTGVAPLTVKFTNTSTNGDNYLWDFGDGHTSTATNPTHTYVNGDESYHVSLTVKNSCDEEDTRTRLNYITTKTTTLSGFIFNNTTTDTIKSGKVFLYRNLGGSLDSIASTNINSDGSYTINNATKGLFYILAKPNLSQYPNNLPTYYPNATQWFNAQLFQIIDTIETADIIVKKLNGSSGNHPGVVEGKVIQKPVTGKIQGPGDPLNGLDVSLIDKSTTEPIAHQESGSQDDQGGFEFTNIPNNSYSIYLDLAGVSTDAGFSIDISPSNTSVYVVVIVDSNQISFDTTNTDNNDTTGFYNPQADNFLLKAAPNPFREFTKIVYQLKESNDVKLSILNLLGEEINVLYSNRQNEGTHHYFIQSDILDSKGLYLLKLQVGDSHQLLKISSF